MFGHINQWKEKNLKLHLVENLVLTTGKFDLSVLSNHLE